MEMITPMDFEEFEQNVVFNDVKDKKSMCYNIATALRFFEENDFDGSITIWSTTCHWNRPYFKRKEIGSHPRDEKLVYRTFNGVSVNQFGIHPTVDFTCFYSYTTHQFTKILPESEKRLCVNLTDYVLEPVVKTMVNEILECEFPKHTKKLLDDIYSMYSNHYRISINTILNKDNRTVEDVITQRGKFPLPPLKKMSFLSGMVARNATKKITGTEYSAFLDFLSSSPNPFCYVHPAYSCLEEITNAAIQYFRDRNCIIAKRESLKLPLEADAGQSA